ncbi:ECF transporter S component [Anaerorhabdus sp.]|uniref:ECF transporter S component n=1 Tax=Anaerorhabdus sp. TaxID=1872524 RepID=UPI002FCB9131
MKSKQLKTFVYLAFFIAIEIVLMLTPLGFIPLGVIRATTLHIPVILAGILLGSKYGAAVGFVFGLMSLIINTTQPTITSFVFSPFVSIGGTSGNFASLLIVFGPRIFLGFFSGWLYQFFNRLKWKPVLNVSVTAIVNTLIHTVLVMGLIAFFFGEPYAQAKGVAVSQLINLLLVVITTNGVAEMIVAAIVVTALYKALKPIMERN